VTGKRSEESGQSEEAAGAAKLSIPGVDTELGLFYVGGNERLYIEVLGSFVRDYADAGKQVAEAVVSGDAARAELLVHTIKGLAGTVGAGDVRFAADQLDAILKNTRAGDRGSTDLGNALEAFNAIFDEFLSTLKNAGIDGSGPSNDEAEVAVSTRGAQAYPEFTVLLVDDDEQLLRTLAMTLSSEGITNVDGATNGDAALAKLERDDIGLVLLDLNLPGESGLEILPRIRQRFPAIPVVVVTADDDVATAVECMRVGALDYLVKGGDPSKFIATTKLGVEIQQLRRENRELSSGFVSGSLKRPDVFSRIITSDEVMIGALHYVEAIATSSSTVLIRGESGTGKDLFAEAVHLASGRRGEFVVANVAGYDDALFADAVFGHVRGAFTGAERSRGGLVDRAAGGTLFLDEIGDLSVPSQIKLLRLLEAREYYPVGSDVPRSTDARIVVATNRDLGAAAADGSFRFDLYYRLATHQLHLPALRKRRGDIRLLFDHFLAEASRELKREFPRYSPELVSRLAQYDFPGNVRELRSMVFDAISRAGDGPLQLKSFPALAAEPEKTTASGPADIAFPDPLPTIKETTTQLVHEAMKRSGGNQTAAAAMLGMSQPALSQRLKRHNLHTS
jgi:DNA-binding NtrC family response regulator